MREAGAAESFERRVLETTLELLGGSKILKTRPQSPLDVHEMLRQGLPAMSIVSLIDSLRSLPAPETCEKAIGISFRTFQRIREDPRKPVDRAYSGRAWKLAEVMAKATVVFGSQKAAERWMQEPAIGLNRHLPIDLLETPPGIALVEEYLGRMEYGVYT